MKPRKPLLHKRLAFSILALVSVGLLNLYSASATLDGDPFFRQLAWTATSALVILALWRRFDYRLLGRLGWWFWGVGVILLVMVYLTGKTAGGSTRWLSLGPARLQPSEIAKYTTLMLVAQLLSLRESGERSIVNLLLAIIVLLIPAGLIVAQPDLGTSGALVMSGALMILFSGIPKRILFVAAISFLIFAGVGWQFLLQPYQRTRIQTMIDPEMNPSGSGYQVIQSKIAIASGGLTGRGFLKGDQTQGDYLPEHHTDFAYAVWAEEWGLVGALAVLILFLWFFREITDIGIHARESLGTYIAVATASYFIIPTAINILMVLGWFPTVGIALPFFTYGGSHTLTASFFLGSVLAVYSRRNLF